MYKPRSNKGHGAHGKGALLAKFGQPAGNLLRHVRGNARPFDEPADLRADFADPFPVVRFERRKPVQQRVKLRVLTDGSLIRFGGDAKPFRDPYSCNPLELPQVDALAPDGCELCPVNFPEPKHERIHSGPLLRIV